MHQSVLLQEVQEILQVRRDDVVVDATFGGGGHSLALCTMLGQSGILLGIDADRDAIDAGESLLSHCRATIHLYVANFRNLDHALAHHHIPLVDKFLFDLGWSSMQLEHSGRGFSFQKDEPLLMTLARDTQAETLTASRIVNTWNEEHIETIIRAYGEEQFSRKIAQAIIAARTFGPITTTTMLAEIITSAVPGWYRHRRLHPATKTFQALRITVNDEIEALEEALGKAIVHLNPSGRIAIISFHSLEDRLVKRRFREWQKEGQGMVITKRPITPSPDEVKKNPRARSAKLRVFEKNK